MRQSKISWRKISMAIIKMTKKEKSSPKKSIWATMKMEKNSRSCRKMKAMINKKNKWTWMVKSIN